MRPLFWLGKLHIHHFHFFLLHLQVLQSPKPVCCFWGINVETDPEYMSRSAEGEYVEGVEGDVESKYEPDHEEQLCTCDTASEKNLIK